MLTFLIIHYLCGGKGHESCQFGTRRTSSEKQLNYEPRHPRQKYLLTVKGLALYNEIKA